jgi:hypothetical protein
MKVNHQTNQYKPWGPVLPIGMVLIALTLMVGCTANFGSLKRDTQVQQAFESNQVPMGYKYYYYGESEPYVIFGIEPRYEMDSYMWREISPDTDQFKEMTRWIWEDYGYHKFGADILDPSGVKVGIMYTAIRETSVKFVGNNQIVVMPHTPFLWGPGASLGGGGIRVQ